MIKKYLPAIIILIILTGAVFGMWKAGWFEKKAPVEPSALPEGIVLFFGEGCPHCKNVEDFLIQNKIDEKLKVTRLEVPFSGKTGPLLESNALLAVQLAQKCNLDVSGGLSIPFMYDGEKCYLGDVDAINFFREKSGIK